LRWARIVCFCSAVSLVRREDGLAGRFFFNVTPYIWRAREGRPQNELWQLPSRAGARADANATNQKERQSTTYLRYVASPKYLDASFLPKRWKKEIDYQDVKLKIIQQEGYDAHDFNLFDDRASLLWRKPYVDGAVRELTAGNNGRSVEQLRHGVEQLMLAAGNRNPNVKAVQAASHRSRGNVKVDVDVDQQEALIRDMRRNPEKYQEQ
jgi:hypothetical protein